MTATALSPRLLVFLSSWTPVSVVSTVDLVVCLLYLFAGCQLLCLFPWLFCCFPVVWILYRSSPDTFLSVISDFQKDVCTCYHSFHLNVPKTITAVNASTSFTIPVTVYDICDLTLVDTGSAVTMISKKYLSRLPSPPPLTGDSLPQLQSVNGSSVPVVGKLSLPICINGREFVHSFLVAHIQPDLVLGLDFLDANSCVVDVRERQLTFPPVSNSVPPPPMSAVCRAHLTDHVCIAPFSQANVPVSPDIPLPPETLFLNP